MAAINAITWWHNYIGYDSEVDDQLIQTVWDAAIKSVEACHPATNSVSPKLPCPHLDNVGGCIKTVGHKKCTCDFVKRQLRA